jgi:uncharacterized protein (DUF1015 family)
MSRVLPFCGLLPQPERAAQVAAVPYDVVNSAEAAALAEGNPLSFLRVSRPEIEMEPGVDLHSSAVYERAAANFRRLCVAAPLVFDTEPHLYVYELTMGAHRQTGIAAAVSVAEYDAGSIKKHEKTRQDKEDDRARHVMTLRSQTGPVFLAYRDEAAVDALVARITAAAPPLFDIAAPDGVRHRFWRADVADSRALSAAFAPVPCLYIADGHHRAASAARAAATCRKENPGHTGEEDYNFFLAVVFPASQLQILPYNRAVRDLNGLGKDEFLAQVAKSFVISPADSATPTASGEFRFYMDKSWRTVRPRFKPEDLGVIGQLDVSILQDYLLAPVLGIADPRTSQRIDFIGGIRGTQELEKLVDGGSHAIAFSMFPTTIAQLFAIADADEIMPPKSTWFEPKLRDGLVCHSF